MIPGDSFTAHYHYSDDGRDVYLHDHPASYILDADGNTVHNHAEERMTFYPSIEVNYEVH